MRTELIDKIVGPIGACFGAVDAFFQNTPITKSATFIGVTYAIAGLIDKKCKDYMFDYAVKANWTTERFLIVKYGMTTTMAITSSVSLYALGVLSGYGASIITGMSLVAYATLAGLIIDISKYYGPGPGISPWGQ